MVLGLGILGYKFGALRMSWRHRMRNPYNMIGTLIATLKERATLFGNLQEALKRTLRCRMRTPLKQKNPYRHLNTDRCRRLMQPSVSLTSSSFREVTAPV